MDCKNAYIPEGERVIFCKKSPKPERHDTKARMHAMCAFQRFCPNVRNCVLLPEWKNCARLNAEAQQGREEAAGEKKRSGAGTNRKKKNHAADGE